jgi:hypothetical protein
MWFFRSFPQKNKKNNRATLISHKLISVALKLPHLYPKAKPLLCATP